MDVEIYVFLWILAGMTDAGLPKIPLKDPSPLHPYCPLPSSSEPLEVELKTLRFFQNSPPLRPPGGGRMCSLVPRLPASERSGPASASSLPLQRRAGF